MKIEIKGVIVPNDDKWIYDWFEMDAVSPRDISELLEKADGEDLEVEINSGGGDVYAGSEIYTALKDYKGKVTVKIVGVAASAAGVIAMAGDPVLISPPAQIMLHCVSEMVYGDHRVLEKEVEILRNFDASIANVYRLKTGLELEKILEMMNAGGSANQGTWLNAQQALELGFVDEIMFDEENRLVASAGKTAMLPPAAVNKLKNLLLKTGKERKPEPEVDEKPLEPKPADEPENNPPPREWRRRKSLYSYKKQIENLKIKYRRNETMKLQDLLQARAAIIDEMRAMIDEIEGKELTPEEEQEFDEKYNAKKAEVARYDKLIGREEEVSKLEADLDKPVKPVKTPSMTADPTYRQKEKLDDGGFKNIGEFMHALRFGDPRGRLASLPQGQGQGGGLKVPDAFAAQMMPWRFQNEWSAGVGTESGVMVPTRFIGGDPLMIRPEDAIVRPRATVIPAGDPPDGPVSMPAFSQGTEGVFGGVTVQWIGEGETKPETDGAMREVLLQPQEVAAHTIVTDKLLRNWEAASSFIGMLLRGATLAAEDVACLSGNGVGKPTGILNSTGALTVNRATANKISYVDIINMYAKFLPEAIGRAVWVAAQDALPQIATLKDEADNYIFIQGDATKGIPSTLCGIPIKFTGKTPSLGSKGDLILVDFTYYLLKDGSGPFVAASEHVLFRQNKTVIKVFWNVDGKGWVDQPLTLENGVAKASPYVILDVVQA
jgi:HK97 family phage major capsid protein